MLTSDREASIADVDNYFSKVCALCYECGKNMCCECRHL